MVKSLWRPEGVSWPSWILTLMRRLIVNTWRRYWKLGWRGKAFVWFLILFHVALITVLVVFGPAKIFQTMYDLAQKLRALPYGWAILACVLVVTSFPPLIGYSTSLTISGFAYGPLLGFAIAGPSSLLGSTLTFIILRWLFSHQIKGWTKQNKKWVAMEQVIQAKGLPLVCLIRLCPIPWVYSNALFASIESVRLWQFVIATLCLMPKMWLIIFIGSQVGKLSDGTTRNKMSTTAKVLDILSIVLTVIVAVFTGWFVWRLTEEKIRHLEGLPASVDEEAANVVDEAARPLLASGVLDDEQAEEVEEADEAEEAEGETPESEVQSPLDEYMEHLTGIKSSRKDKRHSTSHPSYGT